MKKIIVKSGDKYGRFKILQEIFEPGRYRKFQCECSCGVIKIVQLDTLRLGKVISCGCYRSENFKKINLRHGYSKRSKRSKIYQVWHSMKQRCQNPKNKSYPRYGGRGIEVCERWQKFINFVEDMKEPQHGQSLERIDNARGYSKENCKWATVWEQAANKRNNRLLTYGGKTQMLAQWGRETGIARDTLSSRIKKGWTPSQVINTPRYARRK